MQAKHTTHLGRLQRGHGRGLRDILEGRETDPEPVIHCVLHEPRFDRQLEERARYYAEALLALEAPVERIVRWTVLSSGNDYYADELGELPYRVLGAMAVRGHHEAREGLVQLLLETEGWSHALWALSSPGSDSSGSLLDETLVHSLVELRSDEELDHEALYNLEDWRHAHPRLQSLDEVTETSEPGWREQHRESGPKHSTAMSTLDLLAIMNDRNATKIGRILERRDLTHQEQAAIAEVVLKSGAKASARQKDRALAGLLGKAGSTALMPALECFLERSDCGHFTQNQRRITLLKYFRALPPDLSLPLARELFSSRRWGLSIFGQAVLEQHAQSEDRTRLEAAATLALDEFDVYRLCSCIDGLACIGDPRSIPILVRVVEETIYDFARQKALECLEKCVPGEFGPNDDCSPEYLKQARRCFEDALWDCNECSIGIACRNVDASRPAVEERLQVLVDNPNLDDSTREKARQALAG